MKCEAQYYNGRNSRSTTASLLLEEGHFWFKYDENLREIPFTSISSIYELNGEQCIELKAASPAEPSEKFKFKDRLFFQEANREWGKKGDRLLMTKLFFRSLSTPKFISLLILFTAIFLLLGYFGVTNFHNIVPKKYDNYLEKRITKRFLNTFDRYESKELDNFLSSIALKLQPPTDGDTVKVIVLNSPIVNALALPGNTVILFTGLIEKSRTPNEIIGVLAHEMGHVENRHSIQLLIRSLGFSFLARITIGGIFEGVELFEAAEAITELSSTLILLKYSRGFERDADQFAVDRLHKLGYSVEGIHHFFCSLESEDSTKTDTLSVEKNKKKFKLSIPSILSTHPLTQKRIAYLDSIILAESNLDLSNPTPIDSVEWEDIRNGCRSEIEGYKGINIKTIFGKKSDTLNYEK